MTTIDEFPVHLYFHIIHTYSWHTHTHTHTLAHRLAPLRRRFSSVRLTRRPWAAVWWTRRRTWRDISPATTWGGCSYSTNLPPPTLTTSKLLSDCGLQTSLLGLSVQDCHNYGVLRCLQARVSYRGWGALEFSRLQPFQNHGITCHFPSPEFCLQLPWFRFCIYG